MFGSSITMLLVISVHSEGCVELRCAVPERNVGSFTRRSNIDGERKKIDATLVILLSLSSGDSNYIEAVALVDLIPL